MNKTRLIQTCVFGAAAIGVCVFGTIAQERAGYATLSGRPHSQAQQAPAPNYAQRQLAAQKASFGSGNGQVPVRTASMPTPAPNGGCTTGGCTTGGCTTGGCAPMPMTHVSGCAAPASVVGCGSGCGEGCAVNTCAAPAAPCDNGCGCDARVPFPAAGCGLMECTSAGSCSLGGGCGQSVGCTTPAPSCTAPAPSGCGSMMMGGCGSAEGCSSGCAPAPMVMGNYCPQGSTQSMPAQRYARRMARYNDDCYGSGYESRMNRVLGRRKSCETGSCESGPKENFWTRSSRSYQQRNARLSQHLFGWMIPSGHGGQGSPPVGCYNTVYAQDAHYFDQRDGQVYGAQGYGTHITTPLAPNVRHAYNYGWGLPSSRITRVSTVAPYTTLRPLSW